MLILLTNDDGIFSPGLALLAQALRQLGEVCVVAPSREQSGVGQAITFQVPLLVKKFYHGDSFFGYAVDGTPADCVKLGINKLIGRKPDLVVSGMNNGLNVGVSVLYSGTVAATLEASMLGIKSCAVSLQHNPHQDIATIERGAHLAVNLIRRLLEKSGLTNELFNINIPTSAIQRDSTAPEVAVVAMDRTPYWQDFDEYSDPVKTPSYWLSGRPHQNTEETDPQTDVGALARGKISITPLNFDPTDREKTEAMRSWNLELSDGFPEETQREHPPLRFVRH